MSSPRPSWADQGNQTTRSTSQSTISMTTTTTTTSSTTTSSTGPLSTSPPRSPLSSSKLLSVAASPRWAEHADDELLTASMITHTNANSALANMGTASTADMMNNSTNSSNDNADDDDDDDFFATDAELVAALDAADLSASGVNTNINVSGGAAGAASSSDTVVDGAAALLVHGDEFSLRFFLPALVKEKSHRRAALAQLTHQLMQSTNVDLLRSHIRRIVRIHASCPLRDWTAACERVIAHARASQIAVPQLRPISRFFELDAVLSPFTEREGGQVRALFREQFLGSGRLSYLDRVMSFRPDYATVFHTCQVVIMRDPGPLPVVWRHYVALIAAARHRSAYLCELETEQFLLSGGDKGWLDGIAACPTKLQSYAALDAIVAHQPWLLTAAHVAPLLRGNDAWTIGEIVHAMVISATFRALAGIVAGCGINNEVDFVNVNGEAQGTSAAAAAPVVATAPAAAAAAVSTASAANAAAATSATPLGGDLAATELVIKRLQQIELTESSGLNNDTDDNNGDGGNGGGGAEIVEQFDRAGQEDDAPRRPSTAPPPTAFPLASIGGTFFAMAAAQAPAPTAPAPSPTAVASGVPALLRTVSSASATDATSARLQLTEAQERETAYLLKYIGPNTLRHAEFKVQSDQYKVFRVNDWSWPHQGYELLLRFLPRVAQPLDNLFELTQTMTDNCFNTFDNLDTGPYRRAAWQYVQRIKGVLHDDYDYQEINLLLNKYNKEFVKKVVCYPEFITAHDYQQLGYVLAPNEKMHLCALVVESRKQAELLYALHAVMSTMNPTHHGVTQ